jgi:hypothetical protein
MPRRRPPFAPASPARLALVIACWSALLLPAHPALAVVDSLEAMVADADVVAIATLRDVWREKGPVSGPAGRATIHLLEVIKGTADPDVKLVVPSFADSELRTWQAIGRRRIVFLLRSDRTPWHPRDTGLPLAIRTFGWSVGESSGFVAFAPPGARRAPLAVTLDMRAIYDFEEALAAVRASAARTVGETVRYEVLEVPESSVLRQVRPEFAYQELRIPVDDRAQAAAWKWADDPAYAMQTAAVLGHFDSERNVAILTRLLSHPAHNATGRPGKMVTWEYPVRGRARAALERWGRMPGRVATRGPDDFYSPVRAMPAMAVAAAVVALAAFTGYLRRRRRRRAAAVARASDETTVVPGPRRLRFSAVVLAAACGLLLWLDSASRETVHELTATVGDSRYWLSTYQGGLQCVRIQNWPGRRPLSYGRFALAEAPASLWNEQDVIATADRHSAGFRRISGQMWGDWQGATYAYNSLTIPAAVVAGLLGAFPAWHAYALVRDRSRRRARLARGCCVACGYSLHGVRNADRCPECGTETVARNPGEAHSATTLPTSSVSHIPPVEASKT